jgi:hypothetical protein
MHHTSAAPTSATPSASPAQSGIVAVLGGDAAATGTNTVATGDVTNKLYQFPGGVTIATGEAEYTAEGTGPGAQASAQSGVNVTGADIVIEKTVNQHGGSSTDASAESTTKYIAIDIPGWTGGEIVVDDVVNKPSVHALPGDSGLPSSGSVAHSTVTAEDVAHDPQVTVSNHTLALGGHLSAVSSWALVAA